MFRDLKRGSKWFNDKLSIILVFEHIVNMFNTLFRIMFRRVHFLKITKSHVFIPTLLFLFIALVFFKKKSIETPCIR